MRSKAFSACIFAATLSLLAFTISGCVSNREETPDAMTSSAQELRSRVSAVTTQLAATENSLAALNSNQSGLKENFAEYRKNLKKLNSDHEQARKAAVSLRNRGSDYFSSWQQESGAIADKEMRDSHADRRGEVQRDFRDMNDAFDEYQSSFSPVIARLNDIEHSLAADLTPEGLKSVSNAIDDERDSSDKIKDATDNLNKKIDAFISRFSRVDQD